MAESAEGFVNGVQIIGDVCPLGVVSTGALNDHMPRSKMATGGFVLFVGVLPSEEQEHCSRKEAAMDQTQEGLSQHQVVEEDLDQGNEYMNTFK
ncbi:uncharacterized protein LOC144011524 isoform X12 [Festucalex cinctus]